MTVVTGEQLETAYLLQRLSVAIQCGNATCLRTALYDIIVMFFNDLYLCSETKYYAKVNIIQL